VQKTSRAVRARLWKQTPAATYSRPEGLPSAGTGLTSVFGMGTGVAPPVKPPEMSEAPHGARYSVVKAYAGCAWLRRTGRGPCAGGIMAKGSVLRRCFPASQDRWLTLAASHARG
jgi:hypothetical protein